MSIDRDAREPHPIARTGAGARVTAPMSACTSCSLGNDGPSVHLTTGMDLAASRQPGPTLGEGQMPGYVLARSALAAARTDGSHKPGLAHTGIAARPRHRRLTGRGKRRVAQTMPRPMLDAESRSWWQRLHAAKPIRGRAIAELYESLRGEAAFHVRQRASGLAGFPRSDIDDLATEAAGDALIVLLRKLED
jgi:hypothetical protein